MTRNSIPKFSAAHHPETWGSALILLPHPPHLFHHQLPSLFDTTFKVKVTQSCLTLSTPWTIYSPWNSPGLNTGVGSLSLLQRIFPAQGLNPRLPHCKQILYQLSHSGSPSVQFSRSVMSDSLRPHESQHARPPCPSPTPGVHSDSHPSSQ